MEQVKKWVGDTRARARLYHTRVQAKADVFDYTERLHNTIPDRHSILSYLDPVEVERTT